MSSIHLKQIHIFIKRQRLNWSQLPKWTLVSRTNPSGRQCAGGLRGSREIPVSISSSWLSGAMCVCVFVSRRSCRECKPSSAPKTKECSWADVMSNTWITWRSKYAEGWRTALWASGTYDAIKELNKTWFYKTFIWLTFMLRIFWRVV